MKILKMGLGLFGLLIGTITVIAVVRAMSLKPSPMTTIAPLVLREVGQDLVAARLSTAVQYKTVTTQDPAETDWAKFIEFQTWLTETYPDFYGVLDTQMVETYTPVHQWVGTDPALPPLIMLAHQDVVPALESDVGWDYPPFAGVRDGGYIYGRGTLDDKGSLMGLHEAGNYLAAQGWQPERTIYFIFGHDEEVSGSGALAAAKLLQSRGVDPLAVIDEGGAIIRDFNGLEKPLSLIGVAEKGYFTVKLTASAQGGHSSSPPDVTAIGALSRAIAAVEANPFEMGLNEITTGTLKALAPEQDFKTRLAIANLWLFRPLVEGQMRAAPSTKTLLGTSIAPTIIDAGFKENALPREATALINFRIHPRDSQAKVLEHLRRVIDNPDVQIEPGGGLDSEPSPVSPIGAGAYKVIGDLMQAIEPDMIIGPNMLAGGTDSRHFALITDDIYRFMPIEFPVDQLAAIHGLNERISEDSYAKSIAIYEELLRRLAVPLVED